MDPQFASNKRIRKHSFVRKEVLFLGDSRQESSVEKKTSLRPDRRDKVVPHKGHPVQQGSGSSGAKVQTDPPMDPQFASNKRIRKHSFVRKEVFFWEKVKQRPFVRRKIPEHHQVVIRLENVNPVRMTVVCRFRRCMY
uniref:Uncharacterized protein n=1 Tax=Trichobilharzia regenti TaxID=157069 RepID=A0AA85JEY8_TRIRE|nr:unnamed protein product [Trichobilharzia regenti]